MTETVWHKLWVLTLVANEVALREAHLEFFVQWGNRPIDLNKAPIEDALKLYRVLLFSN